MHKRGIVKLSEATLQLSNRALFFRIYILASFKHEGWENSREFETVLQTRDVVEDLRNLREFSQRSECLDETL